VLGAVVRGLRLGPSSDRELDEIEALVYHHQVLFLPDQHLSRDEHRTLAARLGVLRVPEPQDILGITDPLQVIERTEGLPPKTDFWHTDVPNAPVPPVMAILQAVEVPPAGGDTMWATMFGLYEALSPAMQSFCAALHGVHTSEASRAYFAKLGPKAAAKIAAANPTQYHPIVQEHPRTGRKYLYLGASMSRISELTSSESDLLLGYLRHGIDDPNLQVRWRWAPGDVAIWDERSTVHRGLSDHYASHPDRLLHSVYVYARE
jgi:taurine dioxygenase